MNFVLLIILFIVPLATYLYTLCPTILFGDSPEIVTSIYLLGVPHPTGFPVHMLLAKLFALIPLGEYAWRTNTFSALISVFNVILIYKLSLKITKNRFASFGAGLIYAFGRIVWFHATYTQPYSLATFFGLLILYLVIIRVQNFNFKIASLVFFLTGLSLGTHVTVIFLWLTAYIYLLLSKHQDYFSLRKILLKATPFFLLGLSIFLYIPFRAMADPPINWGKPDNISQIIYYFTQRQWQYMMFDRGLYQLWIFSQRIFFYFLNEFTPLGLALALFGLILLWKKEKILAFAFSATIATNIVFFSFYGNQSNLEVLYRYFLPSYTILALCIGYSFAYFYKFTFWRRGVFLMIPLFVIALLISNYKHSSNRDNYFARDHALNLLATVEKEGTLVLHTEDDIFPLLYAKYVLKARPDVKIFDRSGNVFGRDYFMSEIQYLTPKDEVDKFNIDKDLSIVSQTDKEVYFGDNANPQLSLVPKGILFVTKDRLEKEVNTDEIFARYRLPDIDTINPFFKNREEYSRYLLMKARGYFQEKKTAGALSLIKDATKVSPDAWYTMEYAYMLYNVMDERELALETLRTATQTIPHLAEPTNLLASAYEEQKDYEQAIHWYEQTLLRQPGFVEATKSLERLSVIDPEAAKNYLNTQVATSSAQGDLSATELIEQGVQAGKAGDAQAAFDLFNAAIEKDPNLPAAYLNAGNASMNLQPPNFLKAREFFEKALELDPKLDIVRLNLGSICAYYYNDYPCAIEQWKTFLKNNPNAEEAEQIKKELIRLESQVAN